MKILVTSIPFSGMKIAAPIPREELNARLAGGTTDDAVEFTDSPMVELTLTRTHGGVLVKGAISGTCKQGCATCGDLVSHSITAPVDWILQNESDRAAPNDEIDDPGVVVYQGEHVDLEEPLQEALILQLSPFWHPPRDSQDRCLVCQRDCSRHSWGSKEASPFEKPASRSPFGALLQGALKKADRS